MGWSDHTHFATTTFFPHQPTEGDAQCARMDENTSGLAFLFPLKRLLPSVEYRPNPEVGARVSHRRLATHPHFYRVAAFLFGVLLHPIFQKTFYCRGGC